MIRMASAFLISTQWLVMAPRPNDSPRAATVALCQILAWWSVYTTPRARMAWAVRAHSSLSMWEVPMANRFSTRLTVCPLALVLINPLSLVSLTRWAIRSRVQSQDFSSHLSLKGARYKGFVTRWGFRVRESTEAPFAHKAPSEAGYSGSPSVLINWLSRTWAMIWQPIEQKGQTLRTSFVPSVLSDAA